VGRPQGGQLAIGRPAIPEPCNTIAVTKINSKIEIEPLKKECATNMSVRVMVIVAFDSEDFCRQIDYHLLCDFRTGQNLETITAAD
jgi:hypothetical protein